MRMSGPKVNPTAANIFRVLAELQKRERVRFVVRASKSRPTQLPLS